MQDKHDTEVIRVLCGPAIPLGGVQGVRHLIRKMRGGNGRPSVPLHLICHKEIQRSLREVDFPHPKVLGRV